MMTIGLHCRISGKPGRFSAIQEFVDYISTQTGIWVATRKEVAKHFRERFSYEDHLRHGHHGRHGRNDRDGGRHDRDGRDGRDGHDGRSIRC